jgi:sugar phosphate isomerase/epimerase
MTQPPLTLNRLSRRGFLGASAGAALAVTLGPGARPAAAAAGTGNGRLIPAGKVGTILFTQRDAVGRPGIAAGSALLGHVGQPGMESPEDLGPLVPLPGGFLEVFEFLASVGIKQIEFAGLGQNAANPGGTAPNLGSVNNPANLYANRAAYLNYVRTLRTFLDDTGLEAIGNHGYIPNSWPGPGSPSTGGAPAGTMNQYESDRWQLELEAATILGMPFTGTGNDPTSANNRTKEAWDLAAEKWMALNNLADSWGLSVYPHNHSPAYNFLQDGPTVTITQDRLTGNPITPTQVRGESGIRLMEYYLQTTDPGLCYIELDIYWAHVAQHQHRWYYDWDGVRRELVFDPTAYTAANTNRIPLYHAKDGDRTADPVGVGNGYDFVPFRDPRSDIDYEYFLSNQGAKGFHNPNYEQDNAPGGPADPGRSLRYSRWSAEQMNAIR